MMHQAVVMKTALIKSLSKWKIDGMLKPAKNIYWQKKISDPRLTQKLLAIMRWYYVFLNWCNSLSLFTDANYYFKEKVEKKQ